jgi:hypothetical protein
LAYDLDDCYNFEIYDEKYKLEKNNNEMFDKENNDEKYKFGKNY